MNLLIWGFESAQYRPNRYLAALRLAGQNLVAERARICLLFTSSLALLLWLHDTWATPVPQYMLTYYLLSA